MILLIYVTLWILFLSLLRSNPFGNGYMPNLDSMPLRAAIQEIPFAHFGLVAIHLSMIWVWIFLVTESWVRVRAFAYAKRLYSACEKIAVA